ncbi:hypothetical protein H0G86_011677 [Trichoderma simmonsii]|uniref:NWD NACHT-NTPase N-terminal domain-containing protein n=1 Tax=Trichoderma simmonsii TaxID=1491479 RepID=A0A8G0PMJ7_9HYPO|nr:hypothetical protein H0G86_011677 [Trichoderma simmonsii]
MALLADLRPKDFFKKIIKKLKFQNNSTKNHHMNSSRDTALERRFKTKLIIKDNIDSSTSALGPGGLGLEVSDQSEKLKPSLWDRAYDDLKKTDGQLVEEYEKLLSMQLQTNTAKPIDLHDNNHGNFIKAENQINSTDPKIRLEQLNSITSRGLQQIEDGNTKYNIFGCVFSPHNQLAQATRFIRNIRTVIDKAVTVSPYASLVWAGVSSILPTFLDTAATEEACRDGCLYVASRMQFYVKLESLLLPSDRSQASGLSAELENRLIELYRQIIDFQMRTVRRVYLIRLARVKEDTAGHEDWEGMVAKIRELEKILRNDANQANAAAIGRELEILNSNSEKFFTDITSVLVPLLTDWQGEPTSIFRNDGSGSQYNSTGGVQNITIVSGGTVNFYIRAVGETDEIEHHILCDSCMAQHQIRLA